MPNFGGILGKGDWPEQPRGFRTAGRRRPGGVASEIIGQGENSMPAGKLFGGGGTIGEPDAGSYGRRPQQYNPYTAMIRRSPMERFKESPIGRLFGRFGRR